MSATNEIESLRAALVNEQPCRYCGCCDEPLTPADLVATMVDDEFGTMIVHVACGDQFEMEYL
jgi:hypothetical protein